MTRSCYIANIAADYHSFKTFKDLNPNTIIYIVISDFIGSITFVSNIWSIVADWCSTFSYLISSIQRKYCNRLHNQKDKGVAFTTILIVWSKFDPHRGHVVAFLDKMLCNNYFCLVASSNQQFSGQEFEEIYKNIGSPATLKLMWILPNTYRTSHCPIVS